MDVGYLERIIGGCEVIELPVRQKLYRGSFLGERNEYPEMKIITGVKSFAFDREEALRYADPDPRRNPFPNKESSLTGRGVLFTITLLPKCRVFVWENLGAHYLAAGITDYRSFEQQSLFQIARRALRDPSIAGYVTNRDLSQAYEAILDTRRAYFCDVSVDYI